jgi:hypothetical protein
MEVHVDPMKPELIPLGTTKRKKLPNDILLSASTLKFNWRRCIGGRGRLGSDARDAALPPRLFPSSFAAAARPGSEAS